MSSPPSPSPTYHLDIIASPDEVDALEHVSNVVYLNWVQRVAQAHSDAMGYDLRAYRRLGAVFVVKRHEIEYVRPAYAGERIRLSTWIAKWRPASSIRMTSISRLADARGRVEPEPVELTRAETLWALVDIESGRPRRIPETLRAAFAAPPPSNP